MPSAALLVIDMLNPYDHEDADALADNAAAVVEPLADLVRRAREDEVELIYVNDNMGDFAATRHDLVRRALDGRRPELVEPLVPPDDVPFLQKVRHSVFYGTALDHLLRARDIRTIVLTGQVTEQCILYSALDAYIRHFDVTVPRDGVAHIHGDLADAALKMMEDNMSAEITSGNQKASSRYNSVTDSASAASTPRAVMVTVMVASNVAPPPGSDDNVLTKYARL